MVDDVTEPVPETHNVTYEGVLKPAGISIYMEGTHRLVMDSNDESAGAILLESAIVDLSAFENERVRITGSVRPTVEAGGTIMSVQSVTPLVTDVVTEDSSSSEAAESSVALSFSSEAESMSSATASTTRSSLASSVQRSSTPASSAAAVSSAMGNSVDATMQVRADTMAQDMEKTEKKGAIAGDWTQQYCSPHIGFCFPVHRNWYFKSFGATTSSLWHVEVAPQEIDSLGNGPLLVNLLAGAIPENRDLTVVTQGGYVVGYRSWTENRHFEITAPAVLQSTVRYIMQNLISFTPPGE